MLNVCDMVIVLLFIVKATCVAPPVVKDAVMTGWVFHDHKLLASLTMSTVAHRLVCVV